ncbi:MAG: Crp/Fnr family transcriptional regulator [Cytophagales bacterium]|jgi:CRP-like cAMP-binding protein|nr:Crp/Fnr family transcriptional regulator [Cytophagales bacterium]
MDKIPLTNFIRSHFPAPTTVLETIAAQFEERHFAKGEFFLKEGKTSEYLFLADGLMRAFAHDTNGNEVTTYFYPKNRVVFEAASFFMRTVSAENIQALTDCTGYSADFDRLNKLFHGLPEFREFGRLMLVKEFVAYKQRTLAMINKTAEERYSELLETHKEVFQFAPLKQIASYLGVTDTSLSRIRREFAKKGQL